MKKPKPKKKSKARDRLKAEKTRKNPTWRDRALKKMPGEIALINDD